MRRTYRGWVINKISKKGDDTEMFKASKGSQSIVGSYNSIIAEIERIDFEKMKEW
jgi:hypothetical protein